MNRANMLGMGRRTGKYREFGRLDRPKYAYNSFFETANFEFRRRLFNSCLLSL